MTNPAVVDLGIDGIGPATPLASGGFAQVYTAEQTAFRRTVAVKVLFAPLDDGDAFERFERECHALGAVSDHPNIVVVHDRGITGNGFPYIIMEFRRGGALSDHIKESGPLHALAVKELGSKIGGALSVAHGAGVLHRDVKPANILLSGYGEPALADFGIARIEGGNKTTSGKFTASLAHAPREVLDGKEPSEASDVYSLGSSLFELFVGRPPFHTDDEVSAWALISRIMQEPVPDPRNYNMPESLAAVIGRAMSHDLNERYSSAEVFVADLETVAGLHEAQTSANPAIDVSDAPTSVAAQTAARITPPKPLVPAAGPTESLVLPEEARLASHRNAQPPMPSADPARSKRSRAPYVLAVLALVVVVGAAGYIWQTLPVGGEPELMLAQADSGPLTAGETYTLTLTEGDPEGVYQLVIDGEPVGESAVGLPYYQAQEGRHSVSIEIDGKKRTNAVEIYVLGERGQGGYRANLASVDRNGDWESVLTTFDKLVEAGHVNVRLYPSPDGQWWQLFVSGFEEPEAAQGYCDSYELALTECFVGEF